MDVWQALARDDNAVQACLRSRSCPTIQSTIMFPLPATTFVAGVIADCRAKGACFAPLDACSADGRTSSLYYYYFICHLRIPDESNQTFVNVVSFVTFALLYGRYAVKDDLPSVPSSRHTPGMLLIVNSSDGMHARHVSGVSGRLKK